ncbi:MAG: hypothetical protein H7Y37_05310 [Anaerolineae bacterium]|nr:hypothetical protein [Gloeobacterales cyanobacterium ES-bin-313]
MPIATLRKLFIVLLSFGLVWGYGNQVFATETCPSLSGTLLSSDFETDPTTLGWNASGTGATWESSEYQSGTHGLSVQTDTWASPLISTTALQWYRLTFSTKAPGTSNNPGSIGFGYWSIRFYDQAGNLLTGDVYSSVFPSGDWVKNDVRFRAQSTAISGGALQPVKAQIVFTPIGGQTYYIDDAVLQPTNNCEVLNWFASLSQIVPAKLAYQPKLNRWERIPATMSRLRNAQTLRIVMLGDSVQQDTANMPIDLALQNLYPGSHVELIASIKGGTGVSYYQDHVAEYITNYQPDLVIVGGISNSDDIPAYQQVVDQVRASDQATGHTTEFLLLTRQWSPNSYPVSQYYFLSPTLQELDQSPSNNATIPDNDRGHLLSFAATNGVAYLDTTGITSQFIYGAATAAGVGSPDASGNPYSYWMRDFIHSNDNGKLIQSQVLIRFFTPEPATNSGLSYYPLSPCRIVDTRNTATPNLPVGNPTAFLVNSGDTAFNYSAQGGNASGCGIPKDAKAVFFNFVAVGPTSPGDLQAWPFGTAIPTASVLNYATASGLNIANGIILPVCDLSAVICSKDLNVQANQSSAQLVLDVVGYFK